MGFTVKSYSRSRGCGGYDYSSRGESEIKATNKSARKPTTFIGGRNRTISLYSESAY